MLMLATTAWACSESESPGDAGADESQDTGDTTDTTDEQQAPVDLTGVYATDRLLEVSIDIEEDDWNNLRFERRSMTEIFGSNCEEGIGLGERPYNYYPSTVTADGVAMSNVGVRTKGLLGSINPARPSLKVKLQEYDDETTFEQAKRFTFNNQNQDDSRMRTCMAYYLFAAAGVPSSLCNFAHITVNGRDMGIYASVEPIKKPMLARLFGDDTGNLYEGTASDIRAGGFMGRVEKKTNEEEDDWSDIYQLRDAIEAPDETFREELEAILDLDAFITFWAAEALIGHWDGFTGNRNNYFTYNNPVNGKFYFIPWGPDGSFAPTRGGFTPANEADPISVMANAKLARRLWGEADIRTRYQERMEELIETMWKEDDIIREIDRIRALIEPSIMPSNEDGFGDNIEALKNYIRTRDDVFRDEFQNGIPEFQSEIDQEYGCMTPGGEVTTIITTTWGTTGAENPFNTGSGSFTGNIYGFELDFPMTGATAGWAENSEPGDMASLFAIASADFSEFMVALINMPHWLIQPNSSVPIDGKAVSGFFVRAIPSTGNIQLLGFVGGTGIEFGQAGTNDGDVIEATINLEIWGGGGGNSYGTPEEPPDDLGGTPDPDDGDGT
jgi:spore coat protein CotH